MKRIETREVKSKRQKRNNIILGVIMIGLLVLGTAGYALVNQDSGSQAGTIQTKTYNGIDFIRQDNFWVAEINDKVLAFSSTPDELTDIKYNVSINLQSFYGKPIYTVNANTAKDVIGFNLVPEFAERVTDACTEDEECANTDLAIKDCKIDNVIIYRENNEETMIYQENFCIIIEGDKARGTDMLLYKILGLA